MTIAQLIRVAQLLARRNGTQYGARYLRSAGLPLALALKALTKKGKQ